MSLVLRKCCLRATASAIALSTIVFASAWADDGSPVPRTAVTGARTNVRAVSHEEQDCDDCDGSSPASSRFDLPPRQRPFDPAAPFDPAPSLTQVASAPTQVAPGMIGDFFGGASSSIVVDAGVNPDLLRLGTGVSFTRGPSGQGLVPIPQVLTVPSPAQSGAAFTGRQKISENVSPFPQDRLILNFNYFDSVPIVTDGVGVNRFTAGVEKTFLDGLASFEFRAPFAYTQGSTVLVGASGSGGDRDWEFGNVDLAVKGLFVETNGFAMSAGLALNLPTADDLDIVSVTGAPVVRARNDSVHVLPFLGLYYEHDHRFFSQGFLQFDFDVNGNAIQLSDGTQLRDAGRLQDANFVYVDWSGGYWMVDNRRLPCKPLQGLVTQVELHYSRSLNDADSVTQAGLTAGSAFQTISILNATVGMTALFEKSSFTVGYGVPLTNDSDTQFNGELRASFNYFFGGPRRRPFVVPTI